MFNVGPLELIVVLIIALIVLGPQRLPDVARSLGRGAREFRSALESPDDEDDEDVHEDEDLHEDEPDEKGAETEPLPGSAADGPDEPAGEDYQNAAESSESSSSSSGRV